MSFTARHVSVCSDCEEDIRTGQLIRFDEELGLYVHDDCPVTVLRPACPRCFVELPATGVCDDCA